MKYVDEDSKVRMLIAEKHPFKGWRITSLISSSTKILIKLMRIPIQKTLTLAAKLILRQNQKKNVFEN